MAVITPRVRLAEPSTSTKRPSKWQEDWKRYHTKGQINLVIACTDFISKTAYSNMKHSAAAYRSDPLTDFVLQNYSQIGKSGGLHVQSCLTCRIARHK